MERKMESIRVNHVWEVVNLLEGREANRNKWIPKIKGSTNGKPIKAIIQLVTKGFTQQEGINY